MFKYETHLHTVPVSKCASGRVRELMQFYKDIGYDGIFITNHFLDGNFNFDKTKPYDEQINFYFSAYEEAESLAQEIGIKVFCGIESSYMGMDFLIYGLDKEWYLANPQIMQMDKFSQLKFFADNGALIIQAHPFRDVGDKRSVQLFPKNIHGVEVINASKSETENNLAKAFANAYGLFEFAGTDNHFANSAKKLAGMCSEEPIHDVFQFIEFIKSGKMKPFYDIL